MCALHHGRASVSGGVSDESSIVKMKHTIFNFQMMLSTTTTARIAKKVFPFFTTTAPKPTAHTSHALHSLLRRSFFHFSGKNNFTRIGANNTSKSPLPYRSFAYFTLSSFVSSFVGYISVCAQNISLSFLWHGKKWNHEQ